MSQGSSNALLIFASGSEELEAVTVINILRRGGVNVTVAGLTDGALQGSRGTVIVPDMTLKEALKSDYDLLVLPGGMPGTKHLRQDKTVLKLVKDMYQSKKVVSAICAAPSVLAAAGILEGKKVTCYPKSLKDFPSLHPSDAAVVEDGNIITSRGPGTAMDFALALLERLEGADKRNKVESGLVR